ncbi:hypothetical protein Ga0080574_TMP3681 [Salipiger abyssi]|uniref:Uncharacterized protein n=1 Tax=Salipiger abyssi TaxID=1250539 RepID=A0A1P8UXB4_9RHOB|nr:hypothetical protein Ga0080574_TMP3681 [Salipiger abyssi]
MRLERALSAFPPLHTLSPGLCQCSAPGGNVKAGIFGKRER